MSVPIQIKGNNGFSADVRSHAGNKDEKGLFVLTERYHTFRSVVTPFSNTSFGTALNQNVTFGGTPELIFDGGSGGTEWTGTAISGTWDFADAGKVTITSANNNDAAIFDDAGTINMTNYTAITGKVQLSTYSPLANSMILQFGLAGVAKGNTIDLNDYIDTGDFAEQSFVIQKQDLGIDNETVDDMTITITKSSGPKPTISFDDFQIEETGSPVEFKAITDGGTATHVHDIRFTLADNTTSVVTNGTMPGLSYNTLLGVAALTNGIVLKRVSAGKIIFSKSLKQLSDFISIGADVNSQMSDGTNTFLTLEMSFPDPVIIKPGIENYMSIVINDNLSGLLLFNAFAIGSAEIEQDGS